MKEWLGFFLVLFFAASTAVAKIGGGDITYEEKKMGNVVFRHDTHVAEEKLKCTACHDVLYGTRLQRRRVTQAEMEKGQSCGACHNGEEASDMKLKELCGECHKK